MGEKIKKLIIKHKEILLYLIFGVLTTVVRWATQYLFTLFFNILLPQEKISFWILEYDSYSIFISTILSWICAVVFAFITNKLFVFESKSWKPEIAFPEFGKFILARVITGVIEILGIYFLVGIGFDKIIIPLESMDATIVVSVVVIILNYVFSKLIVFKKKN